nr:MAG TPA: hypothetical protein [Caudoviricetes sp.]
MVATVDISVIGRYISGMAPVYSAFAVNVLLAASLCIITVLPRLFVYNVRPLFSEKFPSKLLFDELSGGGRESQ